MRYLHVVLVFLVSAAMGCSGSGSGSSDDAVGDPTATDASISNFDVDGTSSPVLPGGAEPINPNENGGRFSVSYDISADGTVDLELSVVEAGASPVTCGNESTEFFDRDCGPGRDCGLSDRLACRFDTQNRISCEGGAPTDLSPFLDRLPKQADMVLCLRYRGGLSSRVQRVEFQ